MNIQEAIKIIKSLREQAEGSRRVFLDDEDVEAIDTVIQQLEKPTTPKEIEDARKFIRECHADIGFMGSPEYYEKRKMLEEWDKRGETTK